MASKDWRKNVTERIETKKAVVGVIGLGYVGLPLAVEFAAGGFVTYGIDTSPEKIALINAGQSDIDDLKDDDIAPLVDTERLTATSDYTLLKKVDCVAICVPTPLSKTKDPDVSYIIGAAESLRPHLHPGMLVVLESTSYPGTTEELILPMLANEKLKVGRDFFLASSPERIDPGNPLFTTKNIPRIVGGVTPACTRVARTFYQAIVQNVHTVSSPRSAEMVKLLENTFRSVNIGLVNEMALMCDRLKIDVWEIIEAAATKPFGFMPFYPGPGLGGHCIPIDPHYLSWKLKTLNYYARFIELAGDINSHMPEYVVERIIRALNDRKRSLNGARILVLGVTYKRDIQDIRESPALDVIRLLQERGAQVTYNDPHVPKVELDSVELRSTKLSAGLIRTVDCVTIVTDHSAYDYDWVVANARLVLDTRNATKDVTQGREKIVKL
jgi:UDP-N-acetyl-D-glucosamine dehydrogenase